MWRITQALVYGTESRVLLDTEVRLTGLATRILYVSVLRVPVCQLDVAQEPGYS